MTRLFVIFFAFIFTTTTSCTSLKTSVSTHTFTNPLLTAGADPYSFYKDGYYYYTHTTGRSLDIWKTKSITDLKTAERKTVWTPPPNTMYSRQIWAPEIAYINNSWYMHFAADNGDNKNHRMYVIENTNPDPMQGTWVFKGKVADATDKWAIDGNVFEHKNQLYMIWSGWEGDENGQQNIYIAKMSNPWTIDGPRVMISSPELLWERHGRLGKDEHVYVNEGPQFLKGKKDKVFIIYSASGCWTDKYTLGMLTADENADLLDPKSWKKSPEPVFTPQPGSNIYGAGHNSFFKSADGKEDWILYHANDNPGEGCGSRRKPRAQKFTWNKDGTPNFGSPHPDTKVLEVPSGEGR